MTATGSLIGCDFFFSCEVFLPTHVRPVLSKVRPSAHSQRNEPWVFTHRPFVHTPGNTSHSLMSTGSMAFKEPWLQSETHTNTHAQELYRQSIKAHQKDKKKKGMIDFLSVLDDWTAAGLSPFIKLSNVLTFTDEALHTSKSSGAGGVWGRVRRSEMEFEPGIWFVFVALFFCSCISSSYYFVLFRVLPGGLFKLLKVLALNDQNYI